MVHGCAVLDICTDGILMTKRLLGILCLGERGKSDPVYLCNMGM